MAASLLSSGAAMCVERCGLATWCCKMQCNGCMSVAGALFWGGSRSTKPCAFPCKVAAGGDERYLVCAVGAAGVVSCANWFLLCVLQRVAVPVCVVLCVSWICGCRSQWNGCMIVVIWCCVERCGLATWCCKMQCNGCMSVAGALFWGGSRSTKWNLVFFRVKWLQAAMKGTSCVQRVRLGSFHARIGSSPVFCNGWLFLCA